MKQFKDLISQIKVKLKEPLPGEVAQLRMEPPTRRNFNLDPVSSKAKLSSVLILLFEDNDKIKIVFIQRPEYEGVHGGQIAFPGGKKEESDKSLLETALRETHEEIGILPEKVKILGKLSQLYIPPSNFLVEPFVGYTDEKPDFIADPAEVSEIVLIDFDKLLDTSSLHYKEISVRGHGVEVPCYFINEKIIWGATSMILSELLVILK